MLRLVAFAMGSFQLAGVQEVRLAIPFGVEVCIREQALFLYLFYCGEKGIVCYEMNSQRTSIEAASWSRRWKLAFGWLEEAAPPRPTYSPQ